MEEVRRVSFRKNTLKLRRRRVEEGCTATGPSQGNCDRGLGKPSRFGLARRRQRILDKKRERTYGYCFVFNNRFCGCGDFTCLRCSRSKIRDDGGSV